MKFVYVIMVFISVVLLITTMILYFIFGKDYPIIAPINFDVPKDYNSAELCYILESEFTTQSILSLFLFWASKILLE